MITPIRHVLLGSILALGALTLTGCLELDAELDVNSDATISGTISIGVAREAGALMGITSSAGLVDLMESGEAQDGLATEALSCVPDDDNTEKFEADCTFTNTEFSDSTEIWSATREGELITFRVFQEATEEADTEGLIPNFDLGGIDITATFPGDIESVTGEFAIQEDSRTVEIVAPLSQPVDVVVVAQVDGGNVTPIIGWIAVAIVGVAALAGVLFFWRRRGNSGDTIPPAPATASDSQPEEVILAEDIVVIEPVTDTAIVTTDPDDQDKN